MRNESFNLQTYLLKYYHLKNSLTRRFLKQLFKIVRAIIYFDYLVYLKHEIFDVHPFPRYFHHS